MGKIPGGFYIKARCVQQSDISLAPPHVREIWDWFLMNANHKDHGKIMRGQLLTTYNEIIEGLSWRIGYRKCRYTKSQCETAMKYLTRHTMITTARTTRGMIVTVLNYDKFQNVKNYENHSEAGYEPTREPHVARHDIQECKNEIDSNLTVTCEDSGESPPKKDRCPHQKIKSLCDTILPEWRKHRVWDGANADRLRARWNAKYESLGGKKSNTIEFWEGAFKHCRSSPFLMGQVPPSPGHVQFQGSLAWFVKKSNFEKFMEGFYHR